MDYRKEIFDIKDNMLDEIRKFLIKNPEHKIFDESFDDTDGNVYDAKFFIDKEDRMIYESYSGYARGNVANLSLESILTIYEFYIKK